MKENRAQELLKEAFQGFWRASLELQRYYRSLEERVRELTEELERSRLEREEMAQLLEEVMESLSSGVLVVEKGRVVALNTAAQEILDLPKEAILGLPPEDLPLLEQGPIDREDTRRLDGKVIRVQASPLKGRNGQVVVLEDITELEKWRSQAVRGESFNAMEEVASHLAHQVRTPLSVMKLLCSLLEEELRGDPRHDLAEQVLKGVEEIEGVISHILLFIRPQKPTLKPLDLREPLEEVLDFVGRFVKENGIELEKTLSEEPLLIEGDGELLKHVFFNLVLNAVQAMSEGGRLKVEASAGASRLKGELVRVVVQDTGPGIPPEHLRHIFKPFFSTKPKGMGLGLTVVHRIVEAHGGLVEVESQVGKGTRFILSFPRLRKEVS